jgi:hypothetical protein
MKTRTLVLLVLALSLLLYAALAWIDDAIAAALVYERITLDCQAGSATRWADGVRYEGYRCQVVEGITLDNSAPARVRGDVPVNYQPPAPEPYPFPIDEPDPYPPQPSGECDAVWALLGECELP